jgi:hypothetical protein
VRDHHPSSINIIRITILFLFVSTLIIAFYVIIIAPRILQTNASPLRLHNRNFVGTWYSHANVLTIKEDGHAHFAGRVYHWCTEGPAPCDKVEGNIIIPGIQKEIVFNREQDNTLYGTITSSTDHTDGQAVVVRIGSNDTLDFNGELLCGPKAPLGYCGV